MSDQKYNGWTNYATWCVNLWMSNDSGSDEYWREAAEYAIRHPEPNQYATGGHLSPRYTLAQRMKQEFEDAMPVPDASVWTDLLGAALGQVNWDEIAEHWIEDCLEEA